MNSTHVLVPITRALTIKQKINALIDSVPRVCDTLKFLAALSLQVRGIWYETAHLMCTCAFPDHVFRGCKFSFVCFLYTVLEQYDLLNSTVLSEKITPSELNPWVNRWSMIIKELGNALGQLWSLAVSTFVFASRVGRCA